MELIFLNKVEIFESSGRKMNRIEIEPKERKLKLIQLGLISTVQWLNLDDEGSLTLQFQQWHKEGGGGNNDCNLLLVTLYNFDYLYGCHWCAITAKK